MPGRRPHHLVILALLTVAGLSLALMQTLVIPALPRFGEELGASPRWTAWIVTGFLLSSSILTPILGRLGDAHGKQRLLVVTLALFGAGSLGAAFAWDLPSLVACRVVQGAGAAIFPLAFGIIRDEFPPEKVGLGIGTVSSVFGLGGGVGLVLSGAIVEHLGTRWLFLVGAGPVLVATVLVWRFVPESPVRAPGRPDWAGAALLSAGLATILVGLSEASAWGWESPRLLALVAAGGLLLVAWARAERRAPHPLVDLQTLARRGMAATNAATFLVGFALTAFFVVVPAFAQDPRAGFGATPVQAGLLMLPFSAAMALAGPLSGSLVTRRGGVLTLRLGLTGAGAGLALLAAVHAEPWQVAVWHALLGTGVALALTAVGALVLQHSRAAETGAAAGMNSIMRTVGGALGAQVAATCLVATGDGRFAAAFAIAAAAAAAALVPALVLGAGRRGDAAAAPATA